MFDLPYHIVVAITLIPLFVGVLVTTIYYKKAKHTPLKYLTYYLWFLVFVEIVAYILAVKFNTNILWYNIVTNIEKLFFLYLFYQYINNKTIKKIVIIGVVLYELFFFSYAHYTDTWHLYQSFSSAFGSFIIIIAVFAFLIEMFQSNKVLFIKDYLIFWVAIAVLVYYIVSTPYDAASYYFYRENGIGDNNLLILGIIMDAIMYSLITIGYIWSNKPYK